MIINLTGLGTLVGGGRIQAQASASTDSGVVVGTTRTNSSVVWPAPSAERASHALVLAASGAGKTVLVANALISEILSMAGGDTIQPPATASVTELHAKCQSTVIIDPKGDLVAAVLQGLAFTAPEKLADVVYLNPFSTWAFPFNLRLLAHGNAPIEVRAMQLANLVSQVSTATGAQAHLGTGARQVDVLQHLLLGALDALSPRGTVLWTLDALTESKGLKMLAGLTASARAKQFLISAMLSDELRASCASRLRTAFAATGQMERIVTAPACVQFADMLAPNRIVLVDIGEPPGGLQSLQSFWANMLVRLLVEHLMERPSPWTGHHVRLVVDEAQIVAPVLADVAERVLTTGRSRGVSLVVLSQGTALLNQASDTLLRVLLTNTNAKFIGRLAVADAQLLAKEQSPRQGIDESIATVRDRFLTSICNLKDREFYALAPGSRDRFTTATVDMTAWKQAGETHSAEIEAVKTRLALPANLPPRLTLKQAAEEAKRAVAAAARKPPTRGPNGPAPAPSPARSRWG